MILSGIDAFNPLTEQQREKYQKLLERQKNCRLQLLSVSQLVWSETKRSMKEDQLMLNALEFYLGYINSLYSAEEFSSEVAKERDEIMQSLI